MSHTLGKVKLYRVCRDHGDTITTAAEYRCDIDVIRSRGRTERTNNIVKRAGRKIIPGHDSYTIIYCCVYAGFGYVSKVTTVNKNTRDITQVVVFTTTTKTILLFGRF